MVGKVVAGMLSVVLISFMVVLISLYFLQETVKGEINQLNYHMTEVIATNGILTQSLFNNLKDHIGRYGSYQVKLKLEKQIKPGIYDVFFDYEDIIDKRLQIGDRITVYLEDQDMTLFGRMVSGSILGYRPDRMAENRIKSVKSAVIAKNAKDLAKGYDVIVEIERQAYEDQVAVFVQTKLAGSGKYYGVSSHPEVSSTNRFYGDQADEQDNTGINYIYDYGDFLRTLEYDTSGELTLIKYIQQ